jgi:hypothetical protein
MSCTTIALLALFFLREWALVLFLWKGFELLCLVLLLGSFAFTHIPEFSKALLPNLDVTLPMLVLMALYLLYTLVMLRELWKVPRIREHYRRLPTRSDAVALTDSGVLQFGSFFFRHSDMLGAGGTARVYKCVD